jgi:hypothetical protein
MSQSIRIISVFLHVIERKDAAQDRHLLLRDCRERFLPEIISPVPLEEIVHIKRQEDDGRCSTPVTHRHARYLKGATSYHLITLAHRLQHDSGCTNPLFMSSTSLNLYLKDIAQTIAEIEHNLSANANFFPPGLSLRQCFGPPTYHLPGIYHRLPRVYQEYHFLLLDQQRAKSSLRVPTCYFARCLPHRVSQS